MGGGETSMTRFFTTVSHLEEEFWAETRVQLTFVEAVAFLLVREYPNLTKSHPPLPFLIILKFYSLTLLPNPISGFGSYADWAKQRSFRAASQSMIRARCILPPWALDSVSLVL